MKTAAFFASSMIALLLASCSIDGLAPMGSSSFQPIFGSSSSSQTRTSSTQTKTPSSESHPSSSSSTPKAVFILTWNANGGSYIEPTFCEYGEVLNEAPVPYWDPYHVFTGWFLEKELVNYLRFPYTVTNNKTFYAGWEVIEESEKSESEERTSQWSTDTEPAEMVTFTVDSIPPWAGEEQKKIFAWAWPDGDEGSWYSCVTLQTYEGGSASKVSFEAPSDMVGLLLVSCHKDTVEPSWMCVEDMPGRVYHQTADISTIEGVTNYSAPEEIWREYI